MITVDIELQELQQSDADSAHLEQHGRERVAGWGG